MWLNLAAIAGKKKKKKEASLWEAWSVVSCSKSDKLPSCCSIHFETKRKGRLQKINKQTNIIYRLLCSLRHQNSTTGIVVKQEIHFSSSGADKSWRTKGGLWCSSQHKNFPFGSSSVAGVCNVTGHFLGNATGGGSRAHCCILLFWSCHWQPAVDWLGISNLVPWTSTDDWWCQSLKFVLLHFGLCSLFQIIHAWCTEVTLLGKVWGGEETSTTCGFCKHLYILF